VQAAPGQCSAGSYVAQRHRTVQKRCTSCFAKLEDLLLDKLTSRGESSLDMSTQASQPNDHAVDDVYFSRDSMLCRVHRERAVGIFYGQRALMLGATNSLNYFVTAMHTTSRQRPFYRLARTAAMIETVIFADKTKADRVLMAVNNTHRRAEGNLPIDVGQYAVGSRYSALDPKLLLWTIAVIADSTEWFFELLVEPLAGSEKETLWRDYVRLGELFGLPRGAAPITYTDFRRWWHKCLASNDLWLTEEAHRTGYAVAFQIPMPYAAWIRRGHNALMLGSLPSWARAMYGLSYTAEDETRFNRAVKALRGLRCCSPGWIAHGSSRWFYRWVTREEERRIKNRLPTPELATPRTARGASFRVAEEWGDRCAWPGTL
jgi:uncharacterized protein (DUF2236 family)